MASASKRLPSNAQGAFYVDSSCIDCGACRWIAPASFDAQGAHSRVYRQPESDAERQAALRALVSCPTGSIGAAGKPDLRPIVASFPMPLDDVVRHCGFHDEKSFGAASYLLVRSQGNVLIDVPRFSRPLLRRLEDLGGVVLIFLTHRDDVADHRKFHEHFRCPRVLHRSDVGPGTHDVEIQPQGLEPLALAADLWMIPVPGHTRGSTCLLHGQEHLFSGDHLAWSREGGRLHAFEDACWYDWRAQIASMARLCDQRFTWVLPGHGSPCHLDTEEMQRHLRACLAWMRTV